jgi:GntP family gluconate:H+ symporter
MVMLLLLPIARAVSFRTGRNCLLFILAVGAGAIITNGTVPPAPGPLMVAEAFKLNLGLVIAAGFAFGVLPGAIALAGAKAFDRRMPIALRPTPGVSLEALGATAGRPETALPGFWVSVAPVLVPFLLIGAASFLAIPRLPLPLPTSAAAAVEFFGDKNIALGLGAVIALSVHARQARLGWRGIGPLLAGPLEMAGVIILIISAGNAYGEMVKRAGLGGAVRDLAGGHALNFVLLGWGFCALLRVAQGSATVAMITAASIVQSIAGPAGFGVHPLYVMLAIGYGSKFLPWMNDAGFWLVTRVGGITVGEALRSWSILACIISLIGLAEVFIVSSLWPHPGR